MGEVVDDTFLPPAGPRDVMHSMTYGPTERHKKEADMDKIQLGDIRLNVRCEGSGPPLLFVHGFPLDHSMWEGQISEFSRSHQVIAPDLRGFGASELGSEPVSMARYADDLVALLDALEVTQPVTLCGLSMGGYVAWQFWDRHRSRLARLILCDTRAAPDSPEAAAGRRETAAAVLQNGVGDVVETMVPKLFAAATLEASATCVAAIRQVMQATAPQTVAAALLAMAERPDMQTRLDEIHVPSLVLCGQYDAITPVSEMQAMAAALPQSAFREIEAAGHMAPAEQGKAVNRAIHEFLARTDRT